LGDPSGIGPELVSKLLKEEITNEANIVIIGEKNILEREIRFLVTHII
jgi:4-hydroxythreonine-4-phosphate dehydrogenase